MGEEVISGKVQNVVELALLEFVDATDDLDDDEVAAFDVDMRRLFAVSIYNIRWFED